MKCYNTCVNFVDLAIIIALFIFAFAGFGKPLFFELFELASFLLAGLFSLRFYNLAAIQLKSVFLLPHSFANVLGFIVVWYLIEIIFFLWVRFFSGKLPDLSNLPGERFLSVLPALLRGFVFISVVLVLIGTFPIQPKIKSEVNGSKIGSFILAQTYYLEGPLKNVFGGVAQDTLTFLTIQPKTSETVNLGFANDQFRFDEKTEFAMIDLVNKERIKEGLSPLSFDSRLREIARGHSADMFKRGYFSHNTPEGYDLAFRAKAADVSFLIIGENLAFAPTLESAHRGLINSPGHRANILSEDYHQIGIGVANSEYYGLMITQVFKN